MAAKGTDLLRATAVTGGITLVSRVAGLLRDVVIAAGFGMGFGVDAYLVAQRIPNLLRRLFAEGAFAQAFVPVLGEYQAREDSRAVRDLVDHVTGMLALVVSGVALAGMIAAPLVVTVLAPGFVDDPEKFGITATMLRITFPYIAFISLVALSGALLNSRGHFAAAAFTPVLLNVALIAAALWFAPRFDPPEMALAWGIFAGGAIQLAWQFPFLKRIGLLPLPRLRWRHSGVSRVIRLMVPVLFGASVAQINLLFDTLLASFLATGSVSWLYYSDRLLEFPLGVFGIALGTVLLPGLSRLHATQDVDSYRRTIVWAMRWWWLIALPASLALVVLAIPLLATLFGYGATTGEDIVQASYSLRAYGFGLLGAMAVKILAPAFFARQDTRTPVRIAVIALVSNMVLNLLLIVPLRHAGLALATTISAGLNGWLLWRALGRQGMVTGAAGSTFGYRVALAAIAMSGVLFLMIGEAALWLDGPLGWRVGRLTVMILCAVAVYASVLWIVGIRPATLRRP